MRTLHLIRPRLMPSRRCLVKTIVSGPRSSPRSGQPKAQIVNDESRMALPPTGRAAAVRRIGETAAAKHTIWAVHLRIEDVPAPLPHVADHVVEAPGIRVSRADIMKNAARIAGIPGNRFQFRVTHLVGPGAAGVFPFRF